MHLKTQSNYANQSHHRLQGSIKKAAIIRHEKEESYNIIPKTCLMCNQIITYEERTNNFCSQSCGAKNSNMNRTEESKNKQKITLAYTLSKKSKSQRTYDAEVKYGSCKVSFCKICNQTIKRNIHILVQNPVCVPYYRRKLKKETIIHREIEEDINNHILKNPFKNGYY